MPAATSVDQSHAAQAALTAQVAGVLDDRIEAAIESGAITVLDDDIPFGGFEFTHRELAELKLLLLAEVYAEPPPPRRATGTAPGSTDRVEEYRARAERGEGLYAAGDATAHREGDRGLRVATRPNGAGPKVLGWADDGPGR